MTNRLKVSLIHMLCSAVLFAVLVGLLIHHFYPAPFFTVESPVDALIILAGVDIVLGPVLTFMVYKKGKPGLKFDIAFIVICQILAFSYGCRTIYITRPAFLALHGDSFYVVPNKVDMTPLVNTPLAMTAFSQPRTVQVVLPGNARQHLQLAMESLTTGIPLPWQTRYYQPMDASRLEHYRQASLEVSKLGSNCKQINLDSVQDILKTGNTYLWFSIIGSRSRHIAAMNASTLSIDYILPCHE